jgi:hypothetical protein
MPSAELATVENISAKALRNIRLARTRLALSTLYTVAFYVRDGPITIGAGRPKGTVAAAHRCRTGRSVATAQGAEDLIREVGELVSPAGHAWPNDPRSRAIGVPGRLDW